MVADFTDNRDMFMFRQRPVDDTSHQTNADRNHLRPTTIRINERAARGLTVAIVYMKKITNGY